MSTELEAFVRDEKRVAELLAKSTAYVDEACQTHPAPCKPLARGCCEIAALLALLADRDAKLAAVRAEIEGMRAFFKELSECDICQPCRRDRKAIEYLATLHAKETD